MMMDRPILTAAMVSAAIVMLVCLLAYCAGAP